MTNLLNFQDNHNKVKWTLLLSFSLHAIILVANFEFSGLPTGVRIPKNIIQLDVTDRKELDRIKKSFKNKTQVQLPKQIVNNELSGEKVKPENSRFLGEKNQTYDRQSLASQIDIFNKAGVGTRTGSEGSKGAAQTKKSIAKGKAGEKEATKLEGLSGLKALSLGIGAPEATLGKAQLEESRALGIKYGDKKSRGLAKNNDFIEDIPLGDMTNLNTVEFKYYGFYHRIRQKLEQHWGNSLRQKAERMYASGRSIASNKNLITSLAITLNNKGEIVKVHVKSKSGVKELDDAAVESFNRAGPFPNPPKGMLNGSGQATISWGFVVKS